MSSFVGLYTGLSGIQASQAGLDTTSHNIANANTPGYTRQRVELSARPGYHSNVGWIGTGVNVDQIARLRDQFLDDRHRVASGDHAFHAVRGETLASLESLSGEPDEGISARMAGLWEAAETWANDPSDTSTRRQVLTELSSIAEAVRTTAGSWDSLEQDLTSRHDTVTDEVNATLASIDDYNRRIANAVPGRIGPDVYDQRDLLLDDLAGMTGAVVRIDAEGRATATLDGVDLLSPDGPATVAVNGATITVTDANGLTSDVTGSVRGELGGLHQVLTQDIPEWRDALHGFAESLATTINDVNRSGYIAGSPDQGEPLLSFDATDPAGSIRVADDVTPAHLASATTPDASIHDEGNARNLADLRTTSGLEAQLADVVVGLAGEVRSSANAAEAARGVALGAQHARDAEHGVSMDEEMVGLVRYQRAMEASARVMTTVDQALDTLVNRVGIVGR